MKTFTVRDMDRQPRAILKAADEDGSVRIRSRNGRVYSLQPLTTGEKITSIPDSAGRRKAIFSKMIPAAQAKLADKLIAGE